MTMHELRTHDKFYLHEDQATRPKEYFKAAGSHVREFANRKARPIALVDIGCAAGDFLRFLHNDQEIRDTCRFFGLDVMKDLIDEAKLRLPSATFVSHNIGSTPLSEIDSSDCDSFDCITMLGVHSIFDNLDWLENIVAGLRSDGLAIVFGIFNPYPYDVIVKAKKVGLSYYESGWNVHSCQSVINKCELLGINAKFEAFTPNIRLEPSSKDQLRTWTMDTLYSNGASRPINSDDTFL